MKKMLFILSYICIGYLILIISLFIFQRSFLYFPEKEKIDSSYFIDTGLKEEIKSLGGLDRKSVV